MAQPYDPASKASIGLVKRVPSGYIRMGSRFHPRESPPRTVRVSEFDIAHAPVTVSQYAVFLECRGVMDSRWWSEAGWAWLNGMADGWGRQNHLVPDAWEVQRERQFHPVVGVTWFEAEAYCRWLSAQKKQVVRLPTEDEWEYAARGDDGRPYPWGEHFDPKLTNTLESEVYDTVPTATIEGDTSPFGLRDMAGNVQEWTSSAYTPLSWENYLPGPLRVVRGASYNDTAFAARTSYRRAYPPGYFYPFLGFRIVVSIR